MVHKTVIPIEEIQSPIKTESSLIQPKAANGESDSEEDDDEYQQLIERSYNILKMP